MILVALSGSAGSGKSTAARFLVKERGFTEISFAEKLKRHIGRDIFALSESQLYGGAKEIVDVRYGKSPREILQLAGEYLRLIHPGIWIEAAFHGLDRDGKYVISDARYLNELYYLKGCGALTVRIKRVGSGVRVGIKDHPSETEFATYSFDREIDNDGSKEDLHKKILTAIQEEESRWQEQLTKQ